MRATSKKNQLDLKQKYVRTNLTLILLTCRIWWSPNNASRW